MFNPLKYQIFPLVKGVVTFNRHPVSGATVKLIYRFNSNEKAITCLTREDGIFCFREKVIYSLAGILPFEDLIYQKIIIIRHDVEYTAWEAIKDKQCDDPEFSRKLSFLRCELTDEEIKQSITDDGVHRNIMYGLARWDG